MTLVQNFLTIFHTLMQTVNSEQEQEETGGVVTHTILQIVIKITELLRNIIDSPNLPTKLKKALKKIKSLFIPQTKDQEVQENTKETSETSGEGRKEQ